MTPGYIYGLWIGGGIGFVVGAVLLAVARAADRKNYIIQKATPMPLSLVNERDDVWLRGRAECDQPLAAPHFGLSCLYFEYKLEEHVRRTRMKDGKTETYYTWETRDRKSGAAAFRLRQEELAIEIDGSKGELKNLKSDSQRLGSWRHSLQYLPYPADISAVGSVSEKKERLEPYADIPLMVTTLPRDEFVKKAEGAESIMRGIGFFLIWAGAVAMFYGLFDHMGCPVATGQAFQAATLVTAAVAATLVFIPVWALYIYNTFVTYNIRVENAWRQVDVDLKMRYDLIPQLVAAAKGYLDYEKEVLEQVTQLRTQAVAGGVAEKIDIEDEVAPAVQRLTLLVENYPDLKAQPTLDKLNRELKAIEEKIAHGRGIYNEAVREYNDNVQCFPRGLLAQACGFGAKTYFEAVGAERAFQSV